MITHLTDKLIAVGLPYKSGDYWIRPNTPILSIEDADKETTTDYQLPQGQWKILGKVNEISKEEIKTLVEKNNSGENDTMFKDYFLSQEPFAVFKMVTATESLHFLVLSKGGTLNDLLIEKI